MVLAHHFVTHPPYPTGKNAYPYRWKCRIPPCECFDTIWNISVSHHAYWTMKTQWCAQRRIKTTTQRRILFSRIPPHEKRSDEHSRCDVVNGCSNVLFGFSDVSYASVLMERHGLKLTHIQWSNIRRWNWCYVRSCPIMMQKKGVPQMERASHNPHSKERSCPCFCPSRVGVTSWVLLDLFSTSQTKHAFFGTFERTSVNCFV